MSKIKKLTVAKQLLQFEEDKAARVLAGIDKMLLSRRNQLHVLTEYCSEYAKKESQYESVLKNPQLQQNFRVFLAKLSNTIDREREEINRLQSSRDESCDQLRLIMAKREALDSMLESLRREDMRALARREQKMDDELVENRSSRGDH